jgi:hypothetical protein
MRRDRWKIRRLSAGMLAAAMVVIIAPSPLRGQDPAMDTWRRSFSERLDQSIAELRDDAQKQTPPVFVTWGRTGETEGEPAFAPLLANPEKENRFPSLVNILREKGLPASLMGVAAVESGFDPTALSPKGARGLWQLMPETARRYGLAVELERDERLDPVKSTHAAARYMRDLYTQFQDWPLTLAAYNAGENRVERAVNRTGTSDFWTLSRQGALPGETRRYVPAVLEKLRAASVPLPNSSRDSTPSSQRGRTVFASSATP